MRVDSVTQKKTLGIWAQRAVLSGPADFPDPRRIFGQHWECSGTVLCHQACCGDSARPRSSPDRITRYWRLEQPTWSARCTVAQSMHFFCAQARGAQSRTYFGSTPKQAPCSSTSPCGGSDELRCRGVAAARLMAQHCPRTSPVLPGDPPRVGEAGGPLRTAPCAQIPTSFFCITESTICSSAGTT